MTDDSFTCPRCNRRKPKASMAFGMCRFCAVDVAAATIVITSILTILGVLYLVVRLLGSSHA